jgi:molybdopterin-binding protein
MAQPTVRAAAERLGVGYSTLKQWIYQGRVRTTHTAGGHHRISEAEIDRLTSRRTPSKRAGATPPATSGLIVALSGRNRLHGFVDEVRSDGLLGQVRLRIGDQTLTAIITGDAIHELKLRRGEDAVAIIKSTEVMIAREAPVAAGTNPALPSSREAIRKRSRRGSRSSDSRSDSPRRPRR